MSTVEVASARRTMVDTQLRTYDVTSKRLLDAVEAVDRACFMPVDRQNLAYVDQTVVVAASDGSTRTLLAPMVLARMVQAAELEPGDKALDVAGGSGYGAAVMAAMGAKVTALETAPAMSSLARDALSNAGFPTIECVTGSLSAGYAAGAPFDVIFVNGSIVAAPTQLLSQLGDNGRLIVIEGTGRSGRVMVYRKSGDITGKRSIFDAAAVPLADFAEKPAFSF